MFFYLLMKRDGSTVEPAANAVHPHFASCSSTTPWPPATLLATETAASDAARSSALPAMPSTAAATAEPVAEAAGVLSLPPTMVPAMQAHSQQGGPNSLGKAPCPLAGSHNALPPLASASTSTHPQQPPASPPVHPTSLPTPGHDSSLPSEHAWLPIQPPPPPSSHDQPFPHASPPLDQPFSPVRPHPEEHQQQQQQPDLSTAQLPRAPDIGDHFLSLLQGASVHLANTQPGASPPPPVLPPASPSCHPVMLSQHPDCTMAWLRHDSPAGDSPLPQMQGGFGQPSSLSSPEVPPGQHISPMCHALSPHVTISDADLREEAARGITGAPDPSTLQANVQDIRQSKGIATPPSQALSGAGQIPPRPPGGLRGVLGEACSNIIAQHQGRTSLPSRRAPLVQPALSSPSSSSSAAHPRHMLPQQAASPTPSSPFASSCTPTAACHLPEPPHQAPPHLASHHHPEALLPSPPVAPSLQDLLPQLPSGPECQQDQALHDQHDAWFQYLNPHPDPEPEQVTSVTSTLVLHEEV